MLKTRLLAAVTAVALLLSGAVYAEVRNNRGGEAPKTRAEAIQKAKDLVAKLEKMTDAEWVAEHKARQARQQERRGK